MPLTDDVRRLCDRLAYDHDRRWDAVHAIRENAARMMSDVRQAHRERADEMSRRIHDLNAARESMTAEQRHRLTEFHNNLRHMVSEFVGDLQEAHKDRAFQISEHIHDLGAARMKMGAEQERMLMEFQAELHDSVDDFVRGLHKASEDRAREVSGEIHDFGAAREKMSAEQEQMLMEFHTQLHDSVNDYVEGLHKASGDRAKEVSGEIHAFGTARKRMSAEQDRRLAKEHARLEATMSQTRKELRKDIKRAHQTWVDFAAKAPHREPKARAAAHTKPAPAPARAGGGGAAAAADDLTVIPGIGPNRQQRLNGLGIHTFAQLANTTEANLRDALGQSAPLVDVGKWIEEAKKHA